MRVLRGVKSNGNYVKYGYHTSYDALKSVFRMMRFRLHTRKDRTAHHLDIVKQDLHSIQANG